MYAALLAAAHRVPRPQGSNNSNPVHKQRNDDGTTWQQRQGVSLVASYRTWCDVPHFHPAPPHVSDCNQQAYRHSFQVGGNDGLIVIGGPVPGALTL